MFKKITASILAFMLIFGAGARRTAEDLPNTVIGVSAETLTYGDLEYEEIGPLAVKITGYAGSGGEVVIPDAINGKMVTGIDSRAFFEKTSITKVTIPDTVSYIAPYAFCGCTSLESVNIPSSVRSIDDFVFMDCTKLQSMILPDGVVDLGQGVFEGCSSMKTLRLSQEIYRFNTGMIAGCSALENIEVSPENITFLAYDGALYSIDETTTLVVCPAAKKSIEIPRRCTDIGYSAFAESAITSVTLPDNVERIKPYAFAYCKELTTVKAGKHLAVIDNCAFLGCEKLTALQLSNELEYIYAEAFGCCSSLTAIDIPESVKLIGDRAFFDCEKLTAAFVGNKAAQIGDKAFGFCGIAEKVEGFKMYCIAGTAGHRYALDNGLDYVIIGYIRGDVNGDGQVNVNDITDLAAHIKGIKPLAVPAAANVNSDNGVDSSDIIAVASHVKGLSTLKGYIMI